MIVYIVSRMAYSYIKTHTRRNLYRIAEIELIEWDKNSVPVPIRTDKSEIIIPYWRLFNKAEKLRPHGVYSIA